MADPRAPAQRVFRIPGNHLPDLNERGGNATLNIDFRNLTPGDFRTPKPQQNPRAGSLLPPSCGVGPSRAVYRPLGAAWGWHAIVGISPPRCYEFTTHHISVRSSFLQKATNYSSHRIGPTLIVIAETGCNPFFTAVLLQLHRLPTLLPSNLCRIGSDTHTYTSAQTHAQHTCIHICKMRIHI